MVKAQLINSIVDGIPTPAQMEYWEHHAGQISIDVQNDNTDNAMIHLSELKADKRFRLMYEAMDYDEKSHLSIMLIAAEDIKTLAEIDSYRKQIGIA